MDSKQLNFRNKKFIYLELTGLSDQFEYLYLKSQNADRPSEVPKGVSYFALLALVGLGGKAESIGAVIGWLVEIRTNPSGKNTLSFAPDIPQYSSSVNCSELFQIVQGELAKQSYQTEALDVCLTLMTFCASADLAIKESLESEAAMSDLLNGIQGPSFMLPLGMMISTAFMGKTLKNGWVATGALKLNGDTDEVGWLQGKFTAASLYPIIDASGSLKQGIPTILYPKQNSLSGLTILSNDTRPITSLLDALNQTELYEDPLFDYVASKSRPAGLAEHLEHYHDWKFPVPVNLPPRFDASMRQLAEEYQPLKQIIQNSSDNLWIVQAPNLPDKSESCSSTLAKFLAYQFASDYSTSDENASSLAPILLPVNQSIGLDKNLLEWALANLPGTEDQKLLNQYHLLQYFYRTRQRLIFLVHFEDVSENALKPQNLNWVKELVNRSANFAVGLRHKLVFVTSLSTTSEQLLAYFKDEKLITEQPSIQQKIHWSTQAAITDKSNTEEAKTNMTQTEQN